MNSLPIFFAQSASCFGFEKFKTGLLVAAGLLAVGSALSQDGLVRISPKDLGPPIMGRPGQGGGDLNPVGPGAGPIIRPTVSVPPPQGKGPILETAPATTSPQTGAGGSPAGTTPQTNVATPAPTPATVAAPPAASTAPATIVAPSSPAVNAEIIVGGTKPAPPGQGSPVINVIDVTPSPGAGDTGVSVPTVSAPAQQPGIKPIVEIPSMPPPQGAKPSETVGTILPSHQQNLPRRPHQGTTNDAGIAMPMQLDIKEILPTNADLLATMHTPEPLNTNLSKQEKKEGAQACVVIATRPDSNRSGMTLVDFSGDGLILAAVPNNHLQQVFSRANYAAIDTGQAARWCVSQSVVRELAQARTAASGELSSVLVQTNTGWQLMSQTQWADYQTAMAKTASSNAVVLASASTKPAPTAKQPTKRSVQRKSAVAVVARSTVTASLSKVLQVK